MDMQMHDPEKVSEVFEWLVSNWCTCIKAINELKARARTAEHQAATTMRMLEPYQRNPIDEIARQRGWNPLIQGESMSVTFNRTKYIITRELEEKTKT